MKVLIEILDNSINPDLLYVVHSLLPLDYYIPLISHTFSQRWIFIGKNTYRSNKLHSFNDKPAVIHSNNSQYWYQNGKLHRDNDQPAVIYSYCGKQYYKHGKQYYPSS